jgi:hypothetical protein
MSMTQETHSPEPAEPHEESAAEPGAEAQPQEAATRRPEAARLPPREPLRRPQPAGPAAAPKPPPTWILSASGEQLSRDEILARYRRQRGLPEDPFENGARPVPPPGYRDRIMTEPRPAACMQRQQQAPEAPPPKPPRTFTMGQTFAIAAAMALVAGGGAGLMSARFSSLLAPSAAPVTAQAPAPAADEASALAQQLQVAQLQPAVTSRDTVIDKKPVATATLQVEDVTGETNSFIPLALHAEPGGLDKDMLLKISGVPEGAYLTSGHRQDDQVWALSLAELKNLKLVVPQAKDPEIDLAVAAFEPKTGELAAPVKTMTVALKDVVVEPTSAPPPGAAAGAPAGAKSTLPGAGSAALPVPIPPPQSISMALAAPETEETRQLIGSADQLFSIGNVKAALRNYEKAWGNDGSAAAAFGIARSYDPLVLAALAANNGTPDKAQAIQWYQRAASGGNPNAAEAIVRLQMKP